MCHAGAPWLPENRKKFGFGGLQQCVLDLRFYVQACGKYANDKVVAYVNEVSTFSVWNVCSDVLQAAEGATLEYSEQTGNDPRNVLKVPVRIV